MLGGIRSNAVVMNKFKILVVAALLFAVSAQAQETSEHKYMMSYAASYGRANAATWRADGEAPDSPRITRQLVGIMVGWGRTDQNEIAEFVYAARAAAVQANATMDAILPQ